MIGTETSGRAEYWWTVAAVQRRCNGRPSPCRLPGRWGSRRGRTDSSVA